jgi:Fe-S-cluster containining protein
MLTTDIKTIEKRSEQNEDENWEFRTFLKGMSSREVDPIVHRLNEEISAQIDCTACANCCKTVSPVLDDEDITRFAEGLGISPEQLKSQYLEKDEEGYIFNVRPCPFLVDNKCSNYDHRPKDCASFPHLHKKDFIFRTMGIIGNCSVCPIVFNVFERLKDELWEDEDFDDFDEFDY